MKDPYSTLGISRNASEKDIKKAYRKLAMKYHPDRNPGDAAAESSFKEVSHAYDILNNPEKKKNYDTYGNPDGPAHGFNPGTASGGSPFDIFDMFNDVFGRPHAGAHSRPNRPGKDLNIRASITFMESIFGCQKDLKINVNQSCGVCDATGSSTKKSVRCQTCGGTGHVTIRQAFMRVNAQCPDCRGKGMFPEIACNPCSGKGQVPGSESVRVTIPPGVESGMKLRLSGKGHLNSRGTLRGDLLIQLVVDSHNEFTKDGKNIHSTVKMPFTTAALGGVLAVNTVHGVQTIKVAPGTQCNSTLRLKGKGVPAHYHRPTGHHYVHLVVDVPKSMTPQQKELVRKLNL